MTACIFSPAAKKKETLSNMTCLKASEAWKISSSHTKLFKRYCCSLASKDPRPLIAISEFYRVRKTAQYACGILSLKR